MPSYVQFLVKLKPDFLFLLLTIYYLWISSAWTQYSNEIQRFS